jgi:hypothetical protein
VIAGLSLFLAASAPANELSTLSTFAAASARPAICRPASFSEQSQLWGRTRGGRVDRFCGLLAKGYARLEHAPSVALALSAEAAALLPTELEPHILGGRARVRSSDWQGAFTELSGRVTAKGRPLGDVAALRELGLAAAMSGHLAEAAAAYRAVVPRVAFTRDAVLARITILEAAAVLMASGREGLQDATLYLADARRQPAVPGLDDLLVAMLALALDRAGKSEQAEVLVRELDGVWALERFESARDRERLARQSLPSDEHPKAAPLTFSERTPVLMDGELHAVIGSVAASRDPRLARVHLAAYLETAGPNAPFRSWAVERLAALGRVAHGR